MQTVTEPHQLALDGGEVPVATVRPTSPRGGVSAVQAAILAHIDKHGSITTTEAGVIVHGSRPTTYRSTVGRRPGECEHAYRYRANKERHGYGVVPAAAASDRFDWGSVKPGRVSCCPWAGTDGSSAMKRLRKRGLVVQDEHRGPWRRP